MTCNRSTQRKGKKYFSFYIPVENDDYKEINLNGYNIF